MDFTLAHIHRHIPSFPLTSHPPMYAWTLNKILFINTSVTHFAGSAGSLHDENVFFLTSRPNGAFFSSKCLLATCRTCTQVVVVFVVFPSWRSGDVPVYAAVHRQMYSLGCDDCMCHLFFSLLHYTDSHMLSSEDLSPLWRAKAVTQRSLSIFLLTIITDNISILMYIMWVILCLFSALSCRVGALQISIIIMAEDSPHITMQCTTMFEHGHGVVPDVNALWHMIAQAKVLHAGHKPSNHHCMLQLVNWCH